MPAFQCITKLAMCTNANFQDNFLTVSVRPQGIARWPVRTTTRPSAAPAGRGGDGGE